MADVILRPAGPEDAPAIAGIYSYYVNNTAISFETAAPTAEEMAGRIRTICETYPYLVCLIDGRLAGYAYANRHMARAAYGWNVEVTVYLDGRYHGRGIGRALYAALENLLKEMGIVHLYALVASPNEKSEGLHESLGFTRAGVMHQTGYKLGRWHDVIYYEKSIADHEIPPKAICSIHEVDATRRGEILAAAAGLIR